MADDFEQAFEEFMERREFDRAESALFSIIRNAFKAGWLAAGGSASASQQVIKLIHRDSESLKELTDSNN